MCARAASATRPPSRNTYHQHHNVSLVCVPVEDNRLPVGLHAAGKPIWSLRWVWADQRRGPDIKYN